MLQGIVVIGSKQWVVSITATSSELIAGLSGVARISAGTGMLFDMGSDQNYIGINMSEMLFPLDIVFINSSGSVVGVLHDVEPGKEAYFQATATPGARYFLEVNAGEAEGVVVGDNVTIQNATQSLGVVSALGNVMATSIVMTGIATGLIASGVLLSSKKPDKSEKPKEDATKWKW